MIKRIRKWLGVTYKDCTFEEPVGFSCNYAWFDGCEFKNTVTIVDVGSSFRRSEFSAPEVGLVMEME